MSFKIGDRVCRTDDSDRMTGTVTAVDADMLEVEYDDIPGRPAWWWRECFAKLEVPS